MFSFGHCPNVRCGASDARIRNGHIPVLFSGSSLTLTFKSNDDVIRQDFNQMSDKYRSPVQERRPSWWLFCWELSLDQWQSQSSHLFKIHRGLFHIKWAPNCHRTLDRGQAILICEIWLSNPDFTHFYASLAKILTKSELKLHKPWGSRWTI